jgi:hypothetical protein
MTDADRNLPTLQALAITLLARAEALETSADMGRRHLRLLARCLSPDVRLALIAAIDDAQIPFPSEPAYDGLYAEHERWVARGQRMVA